MEIIHTIRNTHRTNFHKASYNNLIIEIFSQPKQAILRFTLIKVI